MNIDKKIIYDIKAISIRLSGIGLKLWENRFKILKWFFIALIIFISYRIYKILTIPPITIKNQVVLKIIRIKKTGYYKLATYIEPITVYFHKRYTIARTEMFSKIPKLTINNYLYAYNSGVLLNKQGMDKFYRHPYRHLIFKAKISGEGSSPFILFYVSFSNPNLADRIMYTPIIIPSKDILENYTVLGRVRGNGYIKLTKTPNNKEPKVRMDKFLYLYPRFKIEGRIKYVKAYIEYKLKNKVYFSKQFDLTNGGLVNLHRLIKNRKIKGRRGLNLFRIHFIVKKYPHKKGYVKFINLELISPNYLPLETVFERFIYKRYFTSFMSESRLFHKVLSEDIRKAKKNNVFKSEFFNSGSKKTVKEVLIHKILNEIFMIDYFTKIKHIKLIKNKMVRHFYRFVFSPLLPHYTELKYFYRFVFSPLLPHSIESKYFYKNILIPINHKWIKIRTSKEFNEDKSYYNKTTYIYIYFNRLNFYKYWTTNKHILKEILKNYHIKADNSIKYFVLRGNNDDYWYGRHYYMRYPIFKGLRVFAFDKKINTAGGHFYYKSLPFKYPKFLSFSKNLHYNNEGKIDFFNMVSNKFAYKKRLKFIKSFNANLFKFLKKSFFTLSMTSDIINTVNEGIRFKYVDLNHVNGINFTTRRFTIKLNNINFMHFRYGLIKFHINGAYNERSAKNFKKLKCLLINFNKTKIIEVPIKYYLLNDSLYFVFNLKKVNLKKVDNITISFESKQLTIPYDYNFKISKNIYLIRYSKPNLLLLSNIVRNEPLYKFSGRKIYLKDFDLSLKEFNGIFKNNTSIISQKMYLKKGIYNITRVRNNFFKLKVASVKKIN